jgi:hypothetical protein
MKLDRKNGWRWIFSVLFLILLVFLLAWFLQDFSRRIIVLPASQLVWLFRQLIDRTPQIFFWLALMILVGVLIGKSFSRPEVQVKNEVPREPLITRRSRVNFWLIQLYHQDDYYQNRLVEFVDRLAIDVLSYVHRLPSWQIEQQIINGEIETPPELKLFLKMKKPITSSRSASAFKWLKKIWSWLKQVFRPAPPDLAISPREVEMGIVLDYLEKQLEIHHDSTYL